MNLFQFLKLLRLVLANGDDIMVQIDSFIAFAKDLMERFSGEMTTLSEEQFSTLATEYPGISTACETLDNSDSTTSGVGQRGVFKDLIGDIINDPQKYIDLFLLFKDLFGKK